MATIVIFVLSLLISAGLLLIKMVELKFGTRNNLLNLIRKLDAQSEKTILALKFRAWQAVQSVRYLFVVKIKDWIRAARERIMQEYEIRQNVMMGRKEIVGNGSASFYLKKITESKSHLKKGKIEDSL